MSSITDLTVTKPGRLANSYTKVHYELLEQYRPVETDSETYSELINSAAHWFFKIILSGMRPDNTLSLLRILMPHSIPALLFLRAKDSTICLHTYLNRLVLFGCGSFRLWRPREELLQATTVWQDFRVVWFLHFQASVDIMWRLRIDDQDWRWGTSK